jgi:hypothetical protein
MTYNGVPVGFLCSHPAADVSKETNGIVFPDASWSQRGFLTNKEPYPEEYKNVVGKLLSGQLRITNPYTGTIWVNLNLDDTFELKRDAKFIPYTYYQQADNWIREVQEPPRVHEYRQMRHKRDITKRCGEAIAGVTKLIAQSIDAPWAFSNILGLSSTEDENYRPAPITLVNIMTGEEVGVHFVCLVDQFFHPNTDKHFADSNRSANEFCRLEGQYDELLEFGDWTSFIYGEQIPAKPKLAWRYSVIAYIYVTSYANSLLFVSSAKEDAYAFPRKAFLCVDLERDIRF